MGGSEGIFMPGGGTHFECTGVQHTHCMGICEGGGWLGHFYACGGGGTNFSVEVYTHIVRGTDLWGYIIIFS